MKPAQKLTDRQLQILALVADGHTDQQIARKLGVEYDTVKKHLHLAYGYLGATGRAHAVAILLRKGLIP